MIRTILNRVLTNAYVWSFMALVLLVLIEGIRRAGDTPPAPFLVLFAFTVMAAAVSGLRAGIIVAAVTATYVVYAAVLSFAPPGLSAGPVQLSVGLVLYFFIAAFLGNLNAVIKP